MRHQTRMSKSICNFAEKLAPQPCHFSFDAVLPNLPVKHQGYLTCGFALFAPSSESPDRLGAHCQWNVAYVLIVRPFNSRIHDSVAFCPAVSPGLLSMHTVWLCNTDGSLVTEWTVGAFVYEDILCYCCLRSYSWEMSVRPNSVQSNHRISRRQLRVRTSLYPD